MALPGYDPLVYGEGDRLDVVAPTLWSTVLGFFVCENFIKQGVLPSVAVGSLCYTYWLPDTVPADHYAEVIYRTLDSYPFGGPCVRGSTGSATFYVAAVTGNDAQIGKFVGGSYVGGSGVTVDPPAEGTVVRITVEGVVQPIVRFFYDGVLQQEWTDDSGSPLTGNRAGLAGNSDIIGTPLMSDFRVGALSNNLELIAQRARMGLRGRTATLTLAENRTLIAQRARAALRGRVATLTLANNLTLGAVRARLAVRGRSAVLTLDNELVLTSRPATVALRGREAVLTLTGGLTLIAQPARVAVRGRTADINLVGNFSLDAQPARLGLRGAVATLTIVTPTPSPVDDGLLSPKLIARAPNPWVRVGGTERKRKKPEPVADAPASTAKPSRLLGGILARAGIAEPAAPGIRTAIAPAAAPQPVVAAPADAASVPQPVVSPAPGSTAAPAPASAFTPFTPPYVGVNGVNDDELRNLRREVARAVANVRDELLVEQQAMADALADLRGESEAAAIEAAAMAEQVAELRAALAEQRDRADGLAAEVAALRKQLRQRQAVEAAARLLVD